MKFQLYFLFVFFINMLKDISPTLGLSMDHKLVTHFTNLVKSRDVILISCNTTDLKTISVELMNQNTFVQAVYLDGNITMKSLLTRKNYARTSVILDTSCNNSVDVLSEASSGRYFNKTYQWMLWDPENKDISRLLPFTIDYIGPNAQLTYVNASCDTYKLWDIHSKGRHLKCKLEFNLLGELTIKSSDEKSKWRITNNIFDVQGIHYRDQFRGFKLRGASVIDQENITTNEQIETILSRPTKDSGVAAFIKYHYELLSILRERFNFTVNFRNARGWAGRLGSTRFRLGFLGIVKRNEADVGASGAFNRINRFAEFDTIHQSWKFESAFLYRFTPDLDTHGKSGNFLAPFDDEVWWSATATVVAINFIWSLVEWINFYEGKYIKTKIDKRLHIFTKSTEQTFNKYKYNKSEVTLMTFGAVCQQGMDPIPKTLPSRTIIITIFLFSLVMYNYYTSSVVGGLLSSTEKGPATVDDIISSPLKVSFEDIGYYKVLFRENKSPMVTRLITRKLAALRNKAELPVYTHIEEAVPYLKNGGLAFHCEVVDAYPEVAKLFDANEICDLRVVSGLMEVELMNWVVHKNSVYTEIFKVAMCRAREIGLIERLLRQRQPKKPACQSLYTVYPVSLTGVLSAFFILLGGVAVSLLILAFEIFSKKQWESLKPSLIYANNRIYSSIWGKIIKCVQR